MTTPDVPQLIQHILDGQAAVGINLLQKLKQEEGEAVNHCQAQLTIWKVGVGTFALSTHAAVRHQARSSRQFQVAWCMPAATTSDNA